MDYQTKCNGLGLC